MGKRTKQLDRHSFFEANPNASAWAASTTVAISEYLKTCRDKVEVPNKNCAQGEQAVIIGAGVAGLTTAYELLANEIGCSCVILEANDRVGGRNYSVRPGDTIAEEGYEVQICEFETETNEPYPPYLNAGPGRIPSAHTHLLDYLKRFNVPLEVYVMDSRSNLTYMEGDFNNTSLPNRRFANDTRGWISQELFRFLNSSNFPNLSSDQIDNFKELLEKFGALQPTGEDRGKYLGSDRSGYKVLPGVMPGERENPLPLEELLDSEFWARGTSFYQPIDFLWQPTLFQPVGGMDQVVHAFKDRVEALGGDIRLGAVVKNISYNSATEKYTITYQQGTTENTIEAKYCFSNVPIPLLRGVLNDDHFKPEFKNALHAVYEAQYNVSDDQPKFLADTTKVGWQANRNLWQQAKGPGDVPIFGGISWSSDEIVQIWYPSDNYHGELGVLTGAYNFRNVARNWGNLPPQERLVLARQGAKNLGGEEFGNGMKHGLAIAWQNIAHIKGGWADWSTLGENQAFYYNNLTNGNQNFYIVGDQLSALPGWQEGAVVSAINAVNKVTDPTYPIPILDVLPNTRLMVECI